MNKYLKSVFVLGCLSFLVGCEEPLSESDEILQNAYDNKTKGLQVEGSGEVTRLLADDLNSEGGRHQQFIVTLDSDQTLKVAHNIDIAPRVNNIATGNRIKFYGVYEWNDKGGVVHWTHKDKSKVHVDGWLIYQDVKYW
jgi:hypothetical protein